MILEIAIILVLTLLNGVLAMSELAIVSSRQTRLQVLAEAGSRGARIAMRLAEDPGRFLSSVQIGITLVGVLAGAFSGATLGVRLAAVLVVAGLDPATAGTLGVGGVVMVVTYVSLIFGELVPKQIALRAPEAAATRIAPLLQAIAVAAAPVVWILDRSAAFILFLLGQSGETGRNMTDEEVKLVIAEAHSAGVIEEAETAMIAGVMRIADRSARGLMTPRHDVEVADAGETREQIVARFRTSGHSRLPLRDGGPDEIVGVIAARDIMTDETAAPFDPRRYLQAAPVIHDSLPALDVIETLRSAPASMVLIFDEYGTFEGIITPMDILGAITGGFDEDVTDEPKMVERDDGSLIVAGWMPVDEFADRIGISLEDDRGFETVAGLVLDLAGVLPGVGDKVMIEGWTVEVLDLDGRRIDKVLVSRSAAT
ncbi:MAG: HlyC/CorC family transporter [Rubellimicrobium sp.]|nr:HlyC/CorC family transporter [Rubellimicrobium sp.]